VNTLKSSDSNSDTTTEEAVGIVVTVAGLWLLVQAISTGVHIAVTLNQANNEYTRGMDNLLSLIKDKRVPPRLATSMRSYFMHCKGLQRAHFQQTTLARLSPALRSQLATHCDGQVPPFPSCSTTAAVLTTSSACGHPLRRTVDAQAVFLRRQRLQARDQAVHH